MSKARDRSGSQGNRHGAQVRQYSSSSPIPMQSPGSSRPFSPGMYYITSFLTWYILYYISSHLACILLHPFFPGIYYITPFLT